MDGITTIKPPEQETVSAAPPSTQDVSDCRRAIEEHIVESISGMFAGAQGATRATFEDFERYRRQYRGVVTRKTDEDLANINVPLTLENVETLSAHMIARLFSSPQYVRAVPGKGASEMSATNAQALMLYHLREAEFQWTVRRGLSQSFFLLGKMILKRGWNYRVQAVPRQTPKGVVIAEEITADHLDVQVVDLTAFYPSHVDANGIANLDWAIEWHMSDRSWLKERQLTLDPETGEWAGGIYVNLDDIADGEWKNAPLTRKNQRTTRAGSQQPSPSASGLRRGHKIERLVWEGKPLWDEWIPDEWQKRPEVLVEVYRSWGIDVTDSWMRVAPLWIIEIAGSKHVIRVTPHPDRSGRWSYEDFDMLPVENEFYPPGIAEIGEGLQQEANSKANQALDIVTMALCNMQIVNARQLDTRMMGNDLGRILKRRKNGLIYVKGDPNAAIAPLPLDLKNVQVGEGSVEVSAERYRRACGATDVIQGVVQGGTATESAQAANYAETRVGLSHFFIEDRLASRFFPACFALIRRGFTREQTILVLGENGLWESRQVRPEDITGEVHFQFMGGRQEQIDSVYRQQVVALYQAIMQDPEVLLAVQTMQKPPVNLTWLRREMARAFRLREPDRFAPDPIDAIIYATEPEEENEVLLAGSPARVEIDDDHVRHIQVHMMAQQQALLTAAPPAFIEGINEHMRQHAKCIKWQIKMQEQQMALAAAQAGNEPKQQGSEKPKKTGPDALRSSAQRGQLNPNQGTGTKR